MKTKIILFILGIIIGAAAIYFFMPQKADTITHMENAQTKQLYTCGMHPQVIKDEPGNCPICGMKLTPIKNKSVGADHDLPNNERKILYWKAPMNPTEIYDAPGKSAMGMDLVPVYKDEAGGDAGVITIDGRVQQNMNLRLTEATTRELTRSIRAYGQVTIAEDYEYTITTKIKGWIEKLYFNTTGQYVKKYQPLLEIYSPELVSTQEEFLLAWNSLQKMGNVNNMAAQNARSLFNSAKRRLELWDISEQEIELLKNTGKVKRTLVLRSPVNGYLIHKSVVEGDQVGKNLPRLFLIADLTKIWVEATVYENELAFLKVGQKASLKLDFMENSAFEGQVDFIYPYLDPTTRSANIRLKVDNPKILLKPDMSVTVNIITNIDGNMLSVPSEAVIRTGVRNLVFVALGGGRFESREIRIGATSDNGFVQIMGGLLNGEMVVTSGQFLLDSESQTREAIAKLRSSQEQKKVDHDHEMQDKKTENKTNLQLHDHDPAVVINSDVLYTCPMHPDFITSDPDTYCPFCEMRLKKRGKKEFNGMLYKCPMHPEFVTTEANDRCPVCEMKLVTK